MDKKEILGIYEMDVIQNRTIKEEIWKDLM